MNYIKFSFNVFPVVPGNEILIAYLGEIGFDSFSETNNGFDAFVKEEELIRKDLPSESDFEGIKFSYAEEVIEQKNWNEEWEKSFSPVVVEDKCCIRASFHPPCNNVKVEVIITPKMSFGTGHHDTTWLMTKNLFEIDLKNKNVLDMGCGTGVLAIVAKKLGAAKVIGIDIDEWSIENAIENCQINNENDIHIFKGDATSIGKENFDVILANINRNVLLADIPTYSKALNKNGLLLLSGFFESDFQTLIEKCASVNLKLQKQEVRNGWGVLVFKN